MTRLNTRHGPLDGADAALGASTVSRGVIAGPGRAQWVNGCGERFKLAGRSHKICYRTLAPTRPATMRVPRVQQGLSGQGGGVQSVAVPVGACATNRRVCSRQKSRNDRGECALMRVIEGGYPGDYLAVGLAGHCSAPRVVFGQKLGGGK